MSLTLAYELPLAEVQMWEKFYVEEYYISNPDERPIEDLDTDTQIALARNMLGGTTRVRAKGELSPLGRK